MTKQIVVALALVVGTAGAASAQASIAANASVAQGAQETGVERDLVFAQATPGGTGDEWRRTTCQLDPKTAAMIVGTIAE